MENNAADEIRNGTNKIDTEWTNRHFAIKNKQERNESETEQMSYVKGKRKI